MVDQVRGEVCISTARGEGLDKMRLEGHEVFKVVSWTITSRVSCYFQQAKLLQKPGFSWNFSEVK